MLVAILYPIFESSIISKYYIMTSILEIATVLKMGKMNNAFVVLLDCLLAWGVWGWGGVNGLGQLHSLKTGSSHHVKMKGTSYGIIFTKVD